MKKYPFYTALSKCLEDYGLDLDEDTFETWALDAWSKIGNRESRVYRIIACPQQDPECGWYVQLPCNATNIEAITIPGEDHQESSAMSDDTGWVKGAIEDFIESRKHNQDELYVSGRYVHYRELGDRIYFNHHYPKVMIIYKGQYADDDGLPYLNNKEANAIAAYCAYRNDYKKARMTKDPNIFQLAQYAKADWQKLCSAARVDEKLSQNQMNEILQASLSWDHARYGIDYKPMKND